MKVYAQIITDMEYLDKDHKPLMRTTFLPAIYKDQDKAVADSIAMILRRFTSYKQTIDSIKDFIILTGYDADNAPRAEILVAEYDIIES